MGEEKQAPGMAEPRQPAAERPVRIAEPRSASATPESAEWDMYTPRKPFVGAHALVGALRNDRTPLNTPYTPQLVKLHLTRHDEFAYEDGGEPAPGLLGRARSSIRAKLAVLTLPVRKIRSAVDHSLSWLVPRAVAQSSVFLCLRPWVVSYLTTVICVPIVWLCSPMLIALAIFTSPVWTAALAVLAIRRLVPAHAHPRLSAEYSPSSDLSTATEDGHNNLSPQYLSSAYCQADYNGSRLAA